VTIIWLCRKERRRFRFCHFSWGPDGGLRSPLGPSGGFPPSLEVWEDSGKVFSAFQPIGVPPLNSFTLLDRVSGLAVWLPWASPQPDLSVFLICLCRPIPGPSVRAIAPPPGLEFQNCWKDDPFFSAICFLRNIFLPETFLSHLLSPQRIFTHKRTVPSSTQSAFSG